MVTRAKAAAGDDRLAFQIGTAEELPFPDDTFDLVVSTTSPDHWSDQAAGLCEVQRVLRPGGHFVLADLFSLFGPDSPRRSRGRVRTIGGTRSLLGTAGFHLLARHNLYVVVQALSARK